MQVIADAWDSGDLPGHAVVSIGNYDGFHRGQRAILDRVVARARELRVPSAMITFDPHPLAFLRPREAPPRLTSRVQKRSEERRVGKECRSRRARDHSKANDSRAKSRSRSDP